MGVKLGKSYQERSKGFAFEWLVLQVFDKRMNQPGCSFVTAHEPLNHFYMNVGVIGSGTAGRALATAFLSEGHSVMLGTRDPLKEEVQKWMKENAGGKAGTFEDTAAFGELLVLVTRGDVASKALEMAGAGNLSGKVIIDATNPIAKESPVNGVLVYFSSINHSLMEDLQSTFTEAKFVKA